MYFQTHFKKIYLRILCVFLAVLSLSAALKHFCSQPVSSAQNTVQIPVLMYHSVCINTKINSIYILSPENFRKDMEYIKSAGYTPVFISEIYNWYKNGAALPEKPIAITFDDGYLNNLTSVLPVLKEFNFKAEINIVGSYTERYSSVEDRNPSYACLTKNDIITLTESGLIEIGNHTWNMHSLGSRKGCSKKTGESTENYSAALSEDINKCNNYLKTECNITPTVFAFPFGEISKDAISVLRACGFRVLLTCDEKINSISKGTDSILMLGRINRSSRYTTEEFMKKYGI